ncbi:MAG: hypothetical protein JSW62_00350, partial [Thermoplasmatales archaeon]
MEKDRYKIIHKKNSFIASENKDFIEEKVDKILLEKELKESEDYDAEKISLKNRKGELVHFLKEKKKSDNKESINEVISETRDDSTDEAVKNYEDLELSGRSKEIENLVDQIDMKKPIEFYKHEEIISEINNISFIKGYEKEFETKEKRESEIQEIVGINDEKDSVKLDVTDSIKSKLIKKIKKGNKRLSFFKREKSSENDRVRDKIDSLFGKKPSSFKFRVENINDVRELDKKIEKKSKDSKLGDRNNSLEDKALKFAKDNKKIFSVVCTESRPINEGVKLARILGKNDIKVKLVVDSAVFNFIPDANIILVGSDAITINGLINKIGTKGI